MISTNIDRRRKIIETSGPIRQPQAVPAPKLPLAAPAIKKELSVLWKMPGTPRHGGFYPGKVVRRTTKTTWSIDCGTFKVSGKLGEIYPVI